MASGSWWNLWVRLVGVVVRIIYISSYYLSLLLLYLFFFAAASLLFVHFIKMFFVLVIIYRTSRPLVQGAPPPVNALRVNVRPAA